MTPASDHAMFIDGKRVPGVETFEVINPATAAPIAQAPDCTREQLDAAVAAARRAFPAWSALSVEARRTALGAVADRILEIAEDVARLLIQEQGKPFADARGEVMGAALYTRAILSLELKDEIKEETADRVIETRRVPLGVVGAIAPWNFPIALAFFKVAPALVTGNTMVLKPSPFTPLSTLKLVEAIGDLLPPGVLNVVSGGDRLGPWLTEHPGIDKISFTGSTQTGRRVMQSASATLKRVTLELGGNDAMIVMPDVDVDAVAEKLFWSAFQNAGQVCVATKRMYIHKDIYEPLTAALVAYARTVKVGDGAEQGTQIGPINNKPQYDRVLDIIADAKAQGYRFLTGGESNDAPGYFVPVTLIDNPPEDSRIVQEEQFGPVLPLLKFDDVDDVIARANASEYGLGGSVWSGDEEAALEIGRRLQTGTVWVNHARYISPLAPFGGHKQSGLGAEGGLEGLHEYTSAQTIVRARRTATA